MIIVIHGEDTYRSRQYRDKIIAKFRAEKDPAGYNVVTIEADVAAVGALSQEIFATPFMAEKRLVLVKGLLSLTKGAAVQKEMLDILQNRPIPESTIVVFWDRVDEVKGKTTGAAIWEILKQEKYREYCPALETAEAVTWFSQELTARGIKIERAVAQAAVSWLGTDSIPLMLLSEQLAAFKPAGTIALADLREFVNEPGDDNIFNLIDSLVQGKAATALSMMRAQYAKGEDDFFVFQMLIRQLRIMVLLADSLMRGENSPEIIAKKLSLHPFVVKKTIPLVKSFSIEELKGLFGTLSEFDKKIKSGRGDLGVLLDTLTITLAERKK